MPRLSWDARDYEVGVDQGVFFGPDGVEAWNGLVSVNEHSVELSSRVQYRDGVKVVNRRREESFSATVEAYSYPEGILGRKPFGFSYRVLTSEGYRTHLVYNATANPVGHTYSQGNPTPFSFEITTKPIPIPYAAPSAHLVIDTDKAYLWTVLAFEDILYGSATSTARLPLPDEVFDIFEVNSILRIIDNGDGTWTATGPDDVIEMISATEFEITWPSVVYLDADTYRITSL